MRDATAKHLDAKHLDAKHPRVPRLSTTKYPQFWYLTFMSYLLRSCSSQCCPRPSSPALLPLRPLNRPFLFASTVVALFVVAIQFYEKNQPKSTGDKFESDLEYYHMHLALAAVMFALVSFAHRFLIQAFPRLDPSILTGYTVACTFYIGKEVGDYSKT